MLTTVHDYTSNCAKTQEKITEMLRKYQNAQIRAEILLQNYSLGRGAVHKPVLCSVLEIRGKVLHFPINCASILSVLVELIQIEHDGEQGVKL